MTQIVDDINAILQKHGIYETITDWDITVTDDVVSDYVKPVPKLSNYITDHLWPTVPESTVYHFTSREAAEGILSTRKFRLNNIEKRYGEGEIVTFCKSHGLTGYLDTFNEMPRYKTLLMPSMFYVAFTDADIGEDVQEYFWRSFAAVDGVRLTIKVQASNPNFRRIVYEKKEKEPIPVLTELTSTIFKKHKKRFILSGISRLSAFYLSGKDYGKEKETRLLYKTWEGIGPQPIGKGASSYVEIPLGTMTDAGYRLDILDVCSTDRPSMSADFKFTLRGSRK